MAVATTPYRQNDYQAANTFRPYRLPVNDIYRALGAQNEFWEQGARQVKAAHDNALNLKLTNETNKEIRDKFMKDSEAQLTKLSSMNLSDPSVQRQGLNIFKPLFEDEGILSDDQSTRHIEKVNADALSFRDKDGGKFYNAVNHQYALSGADEFRNSKDRMAGKKYLEKRKEYEPYYDYTAEYDKILKNCKADSNETQSPFYNDGEMSGYMNQQSLTSRSASKAYNCIQAGMSGKGQRQLQIEGAMNYKNNMGLLASDTRDYLTSINESNSAKLQELAANKGKIKRGDFSTQEEYDTVIKAVDDQINSLTDEINNTSTTVNKLRSGDLSPIMENPEAYAGAVYSHKRLYREAVAAAFTEMSQKYIADPVQLNYIRFKQEEYLNLLDFGQQKELKAIDQQFETWKMQMEWQYGDKNTKSKMKMTPEGKVVMLDDLERITPNLNTIPEEDNTYKELLDYKTSLQNGYAEANTELYNSIIEKARSSEDFRNTLLAGFNMEQSAEGLRKFEAGSRGNRFRKGENHIPLHETSWFRAWSANNNDDVVANWATKHYTSKLGLQIAEKRLELGEQQVAKELGFSNPDEAVASKVKDKVIQINGETVTGSDIASAMLGKKGKLELVTVPNMIMTTSGPVINPATPMVRRFFLNGKEVEGLGAIANDGKNWITIGAELTKNGRFFNSVIRNVDSEVEKVNKKRKEVYSKSGWTRENFIMHFDDKDEIVESIKGKFEKEIADRIHIRGFDGMGNIMVNIPGSSQGDYDKIRNIVGKDVEFAQDGDVIIKGTNYGLMPQAINNPVLRDAASMLSAMTTQAAQTEVGRRVENSSIEIPIFRNGKLEMGTIDTYKESGNRLRYEFRIKGANNFSIKSTDPFHFINQLATLPFEFKKPL